MFSYTLFPVPLLTMPPLYTLGYQGQTIEPFLDLLLAHDVCHIIDVRQLPFSRKPDFSKKRLSAHLERVGIGYTHIATLGTPKALRDEVRRTHNYEAFFAAMHAVIVAQPQAIAQAVELARTQSSALLCFEAHVEECHRLVVAEAITQAEPQLEIIHL